MKPILAAVLLVSCASHPVAPVAPTIDDAGVIARTDAFMATVDRHDLPAFEASVGPAFVMEDQGRIFDAAMMAKQLRARTEHAAPPHTRTCSEPRVFRGATVAVYAGECVEKFPAFEDHKATEVVGWNTVVWSLEAGTWKVAHWAWRMGGLEAERAMWNANFRNPTNFKTTANQHLIDSVKGRTPGTALDLAMGQGRNAIYLATQGWKVTGVDISDEGIRIAKEEAAKLNVALDARLEDMDTYDLGSDRWDLVTMIYAGSDTTLIEKVKRAVKPGGMFVVEFFHKPGSPIGGFDEGQLSKQFAGWKIVKDEVVEDIADWGGRRKTKLVRFAAQKP